MAAPLPLHTQQRGPVTWRSVTLGLLGTILICGLTPYNDYALNNTFLVGNNLPLGVVMLLFVFVMLINGPLNRWLPAQALSPGELTVAFSMTLVSCALPSSGLMRYLPPSLVGPLWHARSHSEYVSVLESIDLPKWILPDFSGEGPRQWMNDPIVTGYLGRWTEPGPIPYWAWLRPAATWGVFVFGLYGALLCMVTIVRRQWHENERLPFPLAQIPLALIERPPPGRWLNNVLRTRAFWIAFGAIFFVHAWNGCQRYWPRYFPEIPVYYNISTLLTEPPWVYVDQKLKDSAVFFTVVGVTYFLSGPVAFSLWFFYVLHQVYRMWLGSSTGDPTVWGQQDQHFGGIIAFTLGILWVGRRHWRTVLAQAFRGERPGEAVGRYLSYRFAFWGMIGCAAVMVIWLTLAGATLGGAVIMVGLLLVLFMVITRIIAETGLVHGQLQVPIYKPWILAVIYGWAQPVPLKTFYYGAMLQTVHYDFREVVPVYASHGLKVADQTIFAEHATRERSIGRRIVALLALSLLVGYVVSFSSMLWTEYTFAWTKDVPGKLVNDWGAEANPRWQLIEASAQYQRGTYYPRHEPAAHLTFGFGFTALLAWLRLRFAAWPLHPIGFLMLGTFPGAHLWFSIFIGWLAKALILRFGGAKLYLSAKPAFLGLIVGESAAAGFWLGMGILLSALDLPYRPVNIMPG